MKKKNSDPVGALKRTGVYMKSSLGVIALALVLAALSAVMTIIGPDKIGKMATIMSDGLFTGIDLAAIAKIGVFLAIIYCLSALFGFIQHSSRDLPTACRPSSAPRRSLSAALL